MNREAMFSSASCEWETPKDFFEKLDAVYHFDLDVCATSQNAKCGKYFTVVEDGLAQVWRGRCWMNPPYGRAIGKWVQKAYESVRGGWQKLSFAYCPHEQTRHGGMITACTVKCALCVDG